MTQLWKQAYDYNLKYMKLELHGKRNQLIKVANTISRMFISTTLFASNQKKGEFKHWTSELKILLVVVVVF